MSASKLGLLLGAALVVAAPRADACGGFFCNNQPVDQTGENVLFVMDEGHVQAHVQIRYEGSADEFSWVVPVTVVPTIGVGTDEIFSILANATRPTISRTYSERNGCGDGDDSVSEPTRGATEYSDAGAPESEVDVLQASVVGPFETVTLDSEDPGALLAWLDENGYLIPEKAEPIIAAYVAADAYFVGLKLVKDAEVGDLVPIVLDMDTSEACVPLRLTAIAATEDMPVTVYFVADGRAVSTNFPEVVLNDVVFHHPGFAAADSTTILSQAVDAAGGRAFTTDSAGASWPLLAAIDTTRYDTRRFATLVDPQAVMDLLAAQGFMGSQLVLGILLEHMPPPEGVEARTFYNCPSCYELEGYTFDAPGLASALEERMVAPLRAIESAIARHTHLTRLATTISPSEMTEDPIFGINPSLPPVDRTFEAWVVRDCRSTRVQSDDFVEVSTEAGHRFCTRENSTDPPDVPFYERIVQHDLEGPGQVLDDRGAEIDDTVGCGDEIPPIAVEDGGALCTASPGVPASGAGLVLVVALAFSIGFWRRSR